MTPNGFVFFFLSLLCLPKKKNTMEVQNGNKPIISLEHSVALEREPPPILQQGSPFTIKVRVKLRVAKTCSKSAMQSFAVNVSLRDVEYLHSLNTMSGSLTSSIQCCTGNCVGHLVQFNDLIIHRPGKYRLRILLAASSFAKTTVVARVDSRMIDVGRVSAVPPSPCTANVPPSTSHSSLATYR